jgi:D-amino-acid dehydrogenase
VSDPRVVVVGGGVIGLACAWELAQSGAQVTVVERDRIGAGVSRGNTGWICPSITYPLPAPGLVREGIKQLVTRGDAFVMRPRANPTFVRWLWSFTRASSPARYADGMRALLDLNRRTVPLYDKLRDSGVEFEMHANGLVVAATTREGLDFYKAMTVFLHEHGFEGEVTELDADAAVAVEPALAGGQVRWALHALIDRYVRPETLTAGLAAALRRSGAEVREGFTVDRFERRNGSIRVHGPEELEADRVVVAAGLGSVGLLRGLGVSVPLVGARGYSVTLGGEGTPPSHALYLAEAKLGLSPYDSGVRLAGVFELGAKVAEAPRGALRKLLNGVDTYLPAWRPDAAKESDVWAGLRPATADGLPLIGAVPGMEGLFVAAGHTMLGVTLAPSTAALLAPLVLRGERAPELAPFDPGRRTP